MDADRPRGITRFFDDVQDPRMDRTRDHKLQDILMIGLVAILGGAEAWTQVELFGKSKRAWFGEEKGKKRGRESYFSFRAFPRPAARAQG
jgi:hypothetical protein